MENFKYLGSVVSADGSCEEEVRRRIQSGWMCWRKISGVLCDKKLSAKVKGKMYKSVVRPAMMYGMDTVAVTGRQVKKMEVAELKMVRWSLGVTRKDRIRNRYIRDCEDCEIGGQAEEWETAMVRTCEEKRGSVHGEKSVGDGVAGEKETRKTEEDVDGCSEGVLASGKSKGGGHRKPGEVERENVDYGTHNSTARMAGAVAFYM